MRARPSVSGGWARPAGAVVVGRTTFNPPPAESKSLIRRIRCPDGLGTGDRSDASRCECRADDAPAQPSGPSPVRRAAPCPACPAGRMARAGNGAARAAVGAPTIDEVGRGCQPCYRGMLRRPSLGSWCILGMNPSMFHGHSPVQHAVRCMCTRCTCTMHVHARKCNPNFWSCFAQCTPTSTVVQFKPTSRWACAS